MSDVLPPVVILAFALVHVFGPSMRFLSGTPRSNWLSLSGGISVAYVFVHLLPELASHQENFKEAAREHDILASAESHIYVLAVLGLLIFYGLERAAKSARRDEADGVENSRVFWLHLGSFAVYNLIIGYLILHREDLSLGGLIVYGVAMTLHFVVNDYGLRQDYGEEYDKLGRWLLAAAPVLGYGLALIVDLPAISISALFALLAGGVVLNVMKEELPRERESRFSAFATGIVLYAALLIIVRG